MINAFEISKNSCNHKCVHLLYLVLQNQNWVRDTPALINKYCFCTVLIRRAIEIVILVTLFSSKYWFQIITFNLLSSLLHSYIRNKLRIFLRLKILFFTTCYSLYRAPDSKSCHCDQKVRVWRNDRKSIILYYLSLAVIKHYSFSS